MIVRGSWKKRSPKSKIQMTVRLVMPKIGIKKADLEVIESALFFA